MGDEEGDDTEPVSCFITEIKQIGGWMKLSEGDHSKRISTGAG